MDGEACPRLESNLSPPSIRHWRVLTYAHPSFLTQVLTKYGLITSSMTTKNYIHHSLRSKYFFKTIGMEFGQGR